MTAGSISFPASAVMVMLSVSSSGAGTGFTEIFTSLLAYAVSTGISPEIITVAVSVTAISDDLAGVPESVNT